MHDGNLVHNWPIKLADCVSLVEHSHILALALITDSGIQYLAGMPGSGLGLLTYKSGFLLLNFVSIASCLFNHEEQMHYYIEANLYVPCVSQA
jgi:hypothetical protein